MKFFLITISLFFAQPFAQANQDENPTRFRRFREAPFIQCTDNGGLRIEHIHIPQILDDSAGVITVGDELWSFTRSLRAENNDDNVIWKLHVSNEDFPGTGKHAIVQILKDPNTPQRVSVKIKGESKSFKFKNCF